jgi:hypothetical protein
MSMQRQLHEVIEDLETQVDGLQAQVRHAAAATQSMGAHCRALEVANHMKQLSDRGVAVFPGRHAAMEIPGLSTAAKKAIETLHNDQPATITEHA